MNVLLTTLNAKYIHSSLAVFSLRQACQNESKSAITTREYTVNHSLLSVVSDIFTLRPDVVALVCYIWNWEMTKDLVSLLRKILPDVKVVLGGPEVSYESLAVLEQCPEADFIICGEGEDVLPLLLKKLAEKEPEICLPGLTTRKSKTSATPVWIADLDQLSFPYEAKDMIYLADKIIYYESSRGCPFSCQYCLSSASLGVRYRNLKTVLREIDFFVSHNVRQVKFVDRTFNACKEHYFPILKHIKGLKTKTNFHFEIAVELLSDEIIDFLVDMPVGRIQFEIGVQSTHQATLTAIDRNNRWEEIVRKVTKLMGYGNIHLHLDLIIGLPYESKVIFAQSFDDVYGLQPNMLQLGFLKMLKGAKIHRLAEEHDYVWMDQAPYEVLANDVLPYEDLRQLKIFEEVFELFYNKGRFHTALRHFTALSLSSFAFYKAFSEYWEAQGYHKVSHSTKILYQYLIDYAERYDPKEKFSVLQLLKYDALISDNGKIRPGALGWNERQYDKEISAFWHGEYPGRYLPGFSFHTWRDIQKQFHIEVFQVAASDFAKTGNLVVRPAIYLFDYRSEVAICREICAEDFWGKEDKV